MTLRYLAYEYAATYKSLEILQPSWKLEVSYDAKKARHILTFL